MAGNAVTGSLEVVLLQDVMATYASNWMRIATTQRLDEIRAGDILRQAGSGPGAEEIKVGVLEVSPIPGGSRIYVERCHNGTKPESYRLGAVLRRLEPEPVAVVARARKRSDQGVNDLLADV